MILDNFLKDQTKMNRLAEAVDILRDIGAFGLFMELADESRPPLVPANGQVLEFAALRAAWFDGYHDCLRALDTFIPNRVAATHEKQAAMDFGARERLLSLGDLTEEEAKELYAKN